MGIPIQVLDKEFRTKKALDLYIRELRDKYDDDEMISSTDFAFMRALLDRHQDADTKIGCGVEAMYVRQHPYFRNSRGFWLRRVDGTETDFSFKMCITPETHLQKVKAAARYTVSDYIIDFKWSFFRDNPDPICPFRHTTLTVYNSHVDHAPPNTFDAIFKTFLLEENLDPKAIDVVSGVDGQTQNCFVDRLLVAKFIMYHQKHARLRVVSAEANLSDIKKLPGATL